jgi:hypothetical protein
VNVPGLRKSRIDLRPASFREYQCLSTRSWISTGDDRFAMNRWPDRLKRYGVAASRAALASAIDYVMGADVDALLALYLVVTALAGWYLRRTGAVLASMVRTPAWLATVGDLMNLSSVVPRVLAALAATAITGTLGAVLIIDSSPEHEPAMAGPTGTKAPSMNTNMSRQSGAQQPCHQIDHQRQDHGAVEE